MSEAEPQLGESTPTPYTDPSIVDLLRQDFQELAETEDVYIPIVGWERSGLAARYVLPESGKELDNIARKVFRETKDKYLRSVYISLDTMIHLCEGLFVKPASVDEYVKLDPEETGNPVSFSDGDRLTSIFNWPEMPKTARQAVLRLFNNNEIPLLTHSEKLQRWMQNTKADLDVEFWESGEV